MAIPTLICQPMAIEAAPDGNVASQSLPGSGVGNRVLFLYRHGRLVHDGILARGVFAPSSKLEPRTDSERAAHSTRRPCTRTSTAFPRR